MLQKATLTYEMTAVPPAVSFGAAAVLKVHLDKEWVEFHGSLYLKQTALMSLLGLKFKSIGMIPKAFGVARLNLFDLYLNGEVGVSAGGIPTVNKLTIGGGICLGTPADCKALMKTAPAAYRQETTYLGT